MTVPWLPLAVPAAMMSFSSVILCIVAMATDHWAETEAPDTSSGRLSVTVKGHRGLIRICPGGRCTNYDDIERVEDYIRGTLAALSLALLSNSIAVVTHVAWILNCGSEVITRILKIVTIILLAVSVFLYFCAVVAFAATDGNSRHSASDSDYLLSWSWGLCILAAVLDFIAICLLILARRKETY